MYERAVASVGIGGTVSEIHSVRMNAEEA
jgi:hypothetical protein